METSTSETDFVRDIVSTEKSAENFEVYRSFLEYFAENVDHTDQLPVRVPNYTLEENEISGAVIDWMIQYLTDKKCPQTLVAPIIKLALDQTHQTLSKTPEQYGYITKTNEYQTLKLMQLSISKINDVCQSLLDNLQLDKLIPSPPLKRPPLYSAKGVKNTRRHMEDRHIIIDDFNSVFGIKDSELTSYYAIFDGHGGTDAAAYSVSHLHCEIAESKHYPNQPHEALREAFINTDDKFIEKSKKQKLMSGTTALCALYRPTERLLVVGWVGDSKALLVSQNRVLQIVNPHKPDSESERLRIEQNGGCVLEFPAGCFRVNGRLAVSRALGDYGLKDVVIGEPDIACLKLNGNEDFLILACDGLWDYVGEDGVATRVYSALEENSGEVQQIASQLIELAKKNVSSDNISVIVVFLKDPHQIVAEHKTADASQITRMDFESSNGEVQQIASQLIELAKKNVSSDNISVIVVFLKDPHQIVAEHKTADASQITRMDFESSNGLHHLDEGISIVSNDETTPSPDKLHADSNKPADLHHNAMEVDEFFFGKNGDAGEFHANINTIPSSFTSNNNGEQLSSNDLHAGRSIDGDHDDFGPETDVDATDDNAISPLSPSGYDFIENVNDGMIQTEEHPIDESEMLVKKPEDNENIQHPFEDNRFMDHVSDHFVSSAATNQFEQQNEHFEDDEPELPNKIDFAEKKVYGDEFDEYDEDDDDEHEITEDVPENPHHMLNIMTAEGEPHVLPTNNPVPIENVVVAESGDESEDEWNYIKVDKEASGQDRDTPVQLESEQDKQHSNQAAEEDITSPTLPTVSLGETDPVDQQSHAIAQAIAQPEETCSELLEKQDSEHPELFDLDTVERSSSVAAEHDSDLGNDQDLEEMDSQLNPDAKEFVPVSPQHPTIGSPFGNGGLHNRLDLIDDDVVSQSPRKGSDIVMNDNNIELPAENDFSEISQRPSELVANELNFDNIQCENGKLIDETKDVQRPESSSSQCSYQEMNMKEAMHGDEKQEFAAESHDSDLANPFDSSNDGIVPTTNGGQQFLSEKDPMNMSFYNEENNPFGSGAEVDMNAVQPLPDYIEDEGVVNEMTDFVAQPIEAQMNQLNLGDLDKEQQFLEETEKPTPITNYVQELATEVTSILNDVQSTSSEQQNIEIENVSQSDTNPDVINISGLSIHADEFVPGAPDMPEPYQQNQEIVKLDTHDLVEFEQQQTVQEQPELLNLSVEQKSEVEIAQPSEAESKPVIDTSASESVIAGAAIAAATAVVGAAAATKAVSTKTKTTDAKKPDVKGKVAPIKKAPVTSKVSLSKPNVTKTTEKPKTAATKVAPRTVASKVSSTTERKPISSTTARKPLSNGTGEASSVVKKTSTVSSTATKSTIGTSRPLPISKPSTTRVASATTTATKTTAPKAPSRAPIAPRVPLSTRTVSKPATSTTATSKVTASKTTTSTVSSTASRVKSAPATSTLRTSTLSKPTTVSSKPGVTKTAVSKVSPTKPSISAATKTSTARTSLGTSSATTKTTPTTRSPATRKPLSMLSKTTPSKSPKVPTTNGVASKPKVVAKSAAAIATKETKEEVKTNGTTNGHIDENGTGADKIIDVSAD